MLTVTSLLSSCDSGVIKTALLSAWYGGHHGVAGRPAILCS
jgi:hypothetical protein